jgi:hypothetical protein
MRRAAIINNARRKMAIATLLGFCMMLVLTYGFLLNRAIVDGIKVQSGQKAISSLGSTVSNLEQQYFQAKNAVTLKKASDLGFTEADNEVYISRIEGAHGLSINNEK